MEVNISEEDYGFMSVEFCDKISSRFRESVDKIDREILDIIFKDEREAE